MDLSYAVKKDREHLVCFTRLLLDMVARSIALRGCTAKITLLFVCMLELWILTILISAPAFAGSSATRRSAGIETFKIAAGYDENVANRKGGSTLGIDATLRGAILSARFGEE